jgi:GDP-D-mannose dehydratase
MSAVATGCELCCSPKRRARICGVAGQDAAYLARLLLGKGYEVTDTSRDATAANRAGLKALGAAARVRVVSKAPNDLRRVLQTVTRCATDEDNLAGQSSVCFQHRPFSSSGGVQDANASSRA